MKYIVRIHRETNKISLPDQLAPGTPLAIKAEDREFLGRWNRTLGVFSIVSKEGVEKNIRLRSHSITRYEGESESHLAMEVWLEGIQTLTASVAFDLPGHETHTQATKSVQFIRSQMTGKVLHVLVAAGQKIKVGDPLLIIEAMKMENKIFSPVAGEVQNIGIKPGDAVQTGKELVRIKL